MPKSFSELFNPIIMSRVAPRVVVIGNSGVGKTSMVQRVAVGEFDKLNAPTVGAGVTPITTNINGENFTYHIWDTAGQDTFRTIVPLYFRDAVCAILVFSLSDPDSFDALDEWVELFYKTCSQDVPILLAGNKSDIINPKVNIDQAKKWASDHNTMFFITSAATGQGIPQLFDYAATICVSSTTVVQQTPQENTNNSSCCG